MASSTPPLPISARDPRLLDEHPLMVSVRNGVKEYLLQSAAHYDIFLRVEPAFLTTSTRSGGGTELHVHFAAWPETSTYSCREVRNTDSPKLSRDILSDVEVFDPSLDSFVPLQSFLAKQFPSYPDHVLSWQLPNWWEANTKTFHWERFPAEIQEHILDFCVDFPRMPLSTRCRRMDDPSRPVIKEVVDKLSYWSALLQVSRKVRAITLDLCFIGTPGARLRNALCITARSCNDFERDLNRLGRYYQMVVPGGLPKGPITRELARTYQSYPKLYPQLSQFATFRHGLRKVCLSLGFLSNLHFFKVTAGDFGRYLSPTAISYDSFERLPNLLEVHVELPQKRRRGWHEPLTQRGPKLFHDTAPCARILHRVIYEQILQILPSHLSVTVSGFVDQDEQDRYRALEAVSLKNKTLVKNCDGRTEMKRSVQSENWMFAGYGDELFHTTMPFSKGSIVFAEKCTCNVQCGWLYWEPELVSMLGE